MNIFAYTETGTNYPGYVSLNEREGEAVLTVRTPGLNGTQVGECPVDDATLKEFSNTILKYLANKALATP